MHDHFFVKYWYYWDFLPACRQFSVKAAGVARHSFRLECVVIPFWDFGVLLSIQTLPHLKHTIQEVNV